MLMTARYVHLKKIFITFVFEGKMLTRLQSFPMLKETLLVTWADEVAEKPTDSNHHIAYPLQIHSSHTPLRLLDLELDNLDDGD